MAADDHLSPDQFFHGTSHEFQPGDMVSPTEHPETGESQAYATSHAANAKMYGKNVYQVEFTGEHKPDPEYLGNERFRMSDKPLRVVRDATDYARQRVSARDFG